MRQLQVHFSHRQQPDHLLVAGTHRIVRHVGGSVRIVDDDQAALLLAQLRLDQRGLWLQVASGVGQMCSIHVNGRPVRWMALLRAGDVIHVDGVEMLLRSGLSSASSERTQIHVAEPGAFCVVLRGLGGLYHGRSITLDRPRLVGRDAIADIVIDDPSFAAQHARLERHGARVLLRHLGSEEGSWINGVLVRECWLQAGDQLVFDTRHRFVVEAPYNDQAACWHGSVPDLPVEPERHANAERALVTLARWPWLLLSAVLLAAALSALLWFGAR